MSIFESSSSNDSDTADQTSLTSPEGQADCLALLSECVVTQSEGDFDAAVRSFSRKTESQRSVAHAAIGAVLGRIRASSSSSQGEENKDEMPRLKFMKKKICQI